MFRQTKYGGFQGRTNKLVDGCYSFWVGGIFPILQQLLKQYYGLDVANYLLDSEETPPMSPQTTSVPELAPTSAPFSAVPHTPTHTSSPTADSGPSVPAYATDEFDGTWLFNQKALQEYLLLCCQERDGGLRDKPSKYAFTALTRVRV